MAKDPVKAMYRALNVQGHGGVANRPEKSQSHFPALQSRKNCCSTFESCSFWVQELEAGGGADVLMYGDSMVEMWKGTYMGEQWSLFRDQPEIWDRFFGHENFTMKAFGFTGLPSADFPLL